jgi:hypothetical protein
MTLEADDEALARQLDGLDEIPGGAGRPGSGD